MTVRPACVSLAALLVLSCGGEAPPPAPPVPTVNAASPAVAARPAPYQPLPTRFDDNPGGMWMPSQIPAQAAKLKELGLQIDPKDLSDPTSGLLSAVVSLGGCSASFVSSEGLVITNHHCATGALQNNSTPAANLLKDGYLAKTRGDEKSNGPTARVYVTRSLTDVTTKVMDGIAKLPDDRARFKAIDKRQKELVAACEKPGTRCNVASFYEGAQHFLIEQMEIRDVRLVWAPPSGVGNYGGEIDNWRWPRHTGDVSLFRAYVGKDGKPADYSPDNVPYPSPHFLKVASEPLRETDLVFVAGYPGRTNSLKTRPEIAETIEWAYPRRQKMFEDYLAKIADVTKDDKDAQIKSTGYVRRFANYLTNTKGQLEGFTKGGLAQEKEKNEQALRAWVQADPARKATYGTVLDDIAKEIAKNAAHREADMELEELKLPKLLEAAQTIVRMAEERPKADADRDMDYQQRNWARREADLVAMDAGYTRKVDEALLETALARAKALPEKERSAAIAMIEKRGVSTLYATTTLADKNVRKDLLQKATTADLKKSKDPLVQLALDLRPLSKEAEERKEAGLGRMEVLKPIYIGALREFREKPFAPDANGTLRITFGTVKGYRPKPEAPVVRPFTTLTEMIAKNKNEPPFNVPQRLLDTARAKKFGPYADAALGDMPVDFMSDLHITGGNSGSASFNAKGELVGLAFDGTYESVTSDWQFQPASTRTIHVDIRYVLWLLDAVDGADHIVKEMGVSAK